MNSSRELFSNSEIYDFANDCLEAISEIHNEFKLFESNPDNLIIINKIFRLAHSIKGTAGMFGADKLASISHELESRIAILRDQKIPFSKDTFEILVHLVDAVEDAINEFSGAKVNHTKYEMTSRPRLLPSTTENIEKSQVLENNVVTDFIKLPNPLTPNTILLQKLGYWDSTLEVNNLQINREHKRLQKKLLKIVTLFQVYQNAPTDLIYEQIVWNFFEYIGKLESHYESEIVLISNLSLKKNIVKQHYHEHLIELNHMRQFAIDLLKRNILASSTLLHFFIKNFRFHIMESDHLVFK